MDDREFPLKNVISLSILFALYPIVLFFSVKLSWIIYKNYIYQDYALFLTSITLLLSIVFTISVIATELAAIAYYKNDDLKLYYIQIYRS